MYSELTAVLNLCPENPVPPSRSLRDKIFRAPPLAFSHNFNMKSTSALRLALAFFFCDVFYYHRARRASVHRGGFLRQSRQRYLQQRRGGMVVQLQASAGLLAAGEWKLSVLPRGRRAGNDAG